MTLQDNRQMHAVRQFALASVGTLQEFFSFIPNPVALQQDRNKQQDINIQLSKEVNSLRAAQLENTQLRKMLELKENSSFNIVAAEVIGKSIHLARNTITLNIGENRGVAREMPVLTEEGLVGKIIATSVRYSIGQILFHRDCRVSARVERSGISGIVAWEGGLNLVMKNVVKSLDIHSGDRIITSEYSSIYPKGIEVGIVVSTAELPQSIFKQVVITPSVDFSRLQRVFVATVVPDTERIHLEQKVVK